MKVGIRADVSGTIRARAGMIVNNALVYVTGGAAWADVRQTGYYHYQEGNVAYIFTADGSGMVWGGAIGAGVEFALSPNWIVGGEFLHTIYQDHAANLRRANGTSACAASSTNCAIRSQLTTDVARVRISYKFGP